MTHYLIPENRLSDILRAATDMGELALALTDFAAHVERDGHPTQAAQLHNRSAQLHGRARDLAALVAECMCHPAPRAHHDNGEG
jgi:hypothetical protein